MTSVLTDSACFLCKQRFSEGKGRVLFKNVILSIHLEGMTVLLPILETELAFHKWRTIKQWSWNPISLIVRVDIGGKADLDIFFETTQSDEMIVSINHYVSSSLAKLKREKEREAELKKKDKLGEP